MTSVYYRVVCEIEHENEDANAKQCISISVDENLNAAYGRCNKPADPSNWHIKLLWAVRDEFEKGADTVLVSYTDPSLSGCKITFYMYRLDTCKSCGDGFSSVGCHPLVCASTISTIS